MKLAKQILAIMAVFLFACTPSMLAPATSAGAAKLAPARPIVMERGLRKFSRADFEREPRHIVPTQAQLRAMPGYNDAIDAQGHIKTTGKHVLAVVGPNAPDAVGAPTPVISPVLPTDGYNYHSTSNLPLFAPTGPSIHDIHQGQTADCYFLAPLASIAFTQPQNVPLQIVREADDQYRMRFRKNNADVWLRVNSSLPSNGVSQFTGNNWVGLYEKGYAYQRNGANTYASLNMGFAWVSFQDLGYTTVVMSPSPAADAAVAKALMEKRPVAIMTGVTVPAGIPLIGRHSHAVTGFDGKNYTFYNPWGIDGAGDGSDPNDGTTSLSVAQTRTGGIASFSIATAYTAPKPFEYPPTPLKPIPGDCNGDRKVNYTDFTILSRNYGRITANGFADGDFDGNKIVNFTDFIILTQNYGTGDPAAGDVPAFPVLPIAFTISKPAAGTDPDNITVTGTPGVTAVPLVFTTDAESVVMTTPGSNPQTLATTDGRYEGWISTIPATATTFTLTATKGTTTAVKKITLKPAAAEPTTQPTTQPAKVPAIILYSDKTWNEAPK